MKFKAIGAWLSFWLLLFFNLAIAIYLPIYYSSNIAMQYKQAQARADLQKIAVLSWQLLNRNIVPNEKIMTDVLQKKQMLFDPWGTPYRILVTSNSILWQSAGSDRTWNTKDDIQQKIPRFLPKEDKLESFNPAMVAE